MRVTYKENFPLPLINENDREFQPRLNYDEGILEALARDIAKNGQHNPVGLFQKGHYYQVIYGFQRVIALKRLGWDTARANIYEDATWEELHEQSISNNERHLDLGDLEKALYVKALQERGFGIPRLCELFGVNKSAIYNYLTVASLDDSTKECLHRRLITLNHAVELARYTDVSKRLETLIMVLSRKWSVRVLKQWMAGGPGSGCAPTLGWIELCPNFLTMVKIDKAPSAKEMAKRGLGPQAIKQQLAHQHDSCDECDYFDGLTIHWHVRCKYDINKLDPGLRQLLQLARLKGLLLHFNPEVNEWRRREWEKFINKNGQGNITLMGLFSLRPFCVPPDYLLPWYLIIERGNTPEWVGPVLDQATHYAKFLLATLKPEDIERLRAMVEGNPVYKRYLKELKTKQPLSIL